MKGVNKELNRYIIIFLSVLVLDIFTKLAIVNNFMLHESKTITSFFNIVFVKNTGVAFSFFQNSNLLFLIVTLLFLVFLAYWFIKKYAILSKLEKYAIVLILAGGSGNLIDRFTRNGVVDFLDFHLGRRHWPAFNVADSAISVGAVLILIFVLISKKNNKADA